LFATFSIHRTGICIRKPQRQLLAHL